MIIGIPLHNDKEAFQEMMQSLYESTKFYDKIVVVLGDNITDGSDKKAYNFKKFLNKKMEVIDAKTKTPLEAYNIIFDYARENESDLLITQTDVIFPKLYKRDWLEQMHQVAQIENCGAVTCLNGGGVSGPSYIDGFHWLGGWCTYYPLRTLKLIKGYDADYPKGYGVDVDHTYQIIKNNLKIYKINYWVDHHMMNERLHDNSSDSEEAKQNAAKHFRKKWGLDETSTN